MNTNDFSNIKLVTSLDENIKIIRDIFVNDKTIVYRAISFGTSISTKCMLIFINGMADSQMINENIIKPMLLSNIPDTNPSEIMNVLMQEVLLTGDNKTCSEVDDIVNGIIYGKTMLFIDGFADVLVIDTIGWKTRNISEPQAETIVRGLGRWSEFFVFVAIIVFLTITVLSIPQMDISKLKPILSSGSAPVLKGAFSAFSYPFGETIIFTMVFSNISKTKNYNKIFMLGLLIGGGLVFLATLRNILLLGSNTIARVYYPSTMAISLIRVGELLERLEMLVTIDFLICVFVKACICIFAVCNGISKVFGLDDCKFIATPITLLMLAFSSFVYKSIMEMSFWNFNIWQYYAIPFEVIIPLIVFIMAEMKNRNSKFTLSNK
ncbi:endospore germination permease [Clostridium bowmanii]|uniref:endospore germination permease n=1 Tax=Clostridium bowmanii TaxID=132925 RepID=UPI001C0CC071|nr:endospore germination permease [Clostridium bowmanii]MBU3189621.1 endospore germination permease [Clostridium bowmanii]MCA1073535.1 endospore germination permease [Clostridium bowmanii]